MFKTLKQRVHYIQPEIADNWKLHHDNAPVYTDFFETHFLVNSKIQTVSQSPYYCFDVIPPDFILFLRLKITMTGPHFKTADKVKDFFIKSIKKILEEVYHDTFDA